VAVYSGQASDYEIRYQDNGFFLTHLNAGSDGVDFLVGVETLRFADGDVVLPLGVSVHAVNAVVAEGNAGSGGALVFEVRLSQPATEAIQVAYQVEFGGANAASAADVLQGALSGTVDFAVGDSIQTITIPLVGDDVLEVDEVLQVRLTSLSTGALLLSPVAQGTIQNDDAFQMTATTFNGTAANEIVKGTAGNDVITGGAGDDTLDGAEGSDLYLINALADFTAADRIQDTGVTGVDELRFASTTPGTLVLGANLAGLERVSIGTGAAAAPVTTGTAAINIDARAVGNGLIMVGNNGANLIQGTAFDNTLTGNGGNDTLEGGAGNDILEGGAGNDSLLGGDGLDVLVGGAGADVLNGGAGADTFRFAPGDSGQTQAASDVIQDYQRGAFGTGDLFDFSANLTVGGSALAATGAQASINQTTGIATFAGGSGTTMADALNDITARFTAAANSAGEMALFRVNNTGNYYLFVSDGAAGVTGNDVLVTLVGVTAIGGIAFNAGNLNVL
jgi:Ca2+-binding RTX toxin-like protein